MTTDNRITVKMFPSLGSFRSEESGIKRVVEAYYRYLPDHGFDFTDSDDADLIVAHAGVHTYPDVAHCHGLYWTASYQASRYEWATNAFVIQTLRFAKVVTVPSTWVARTIQRDMRFTPYVIGHGIEADQWNPNLKKNKFVLWNKNRYGDVCDPTPVTQLAERFPEVSFITTYATKEAPRNVKTIGVVPHSEMKDMLEHCGVYLATTKETFGIGILEAMAAGVPVLGYRHGGIRDIVEHGVNGYLAVPGNVDDLANGLLFCMENASTLGQNGRELVKEHSWPKMIELVAQCYREAYTKKYDYRPFHTEY